MDADRSVANSVEVGSGMDVIIGLADTDRRRVLAVEPGATAIDQVARPLPASSIPLSMSSLRPRGVGRSGRVGPPGGIV